jgi:hypothetical protein
MKEPKDIRKEALLKIGGSAPKPPRFNAWGQNDWITMNALERRIGQRRGATRAPTQAPEWHGAAPAAPEKSDPPVRNLLRPKNGLDNGVHLR